MSIIELRQPGDAERSVELTNDQFAREQLSRWTHAAGRQGKTVTEAVMHDVFAIPEGTDIKTIDRTLRLQDLIEDDAIDLSRIKDPLADVFLQARASLQPGNAVQAQVLYSLYRLHLTTMANELGDQAPSPHVVNLVNAIIADGRKQQQMARATHLYAIS